MNFWGTRTKKHECTRFRTLSKKLGLHKCHKCGKVFNKKNEVVIIPIGTKTKDLQ